MADEHAGAINTDRELWRENDYYSDSVHVTESGGIGINCGGLVIVKRCSGWHEAAIGYDALRVENAEQAASLSDYAHIAENKNVRIAALEAELATLRAGPASERVQHTLDDVLGAINDSNDNRARRYTATLTNAYAVLESLSRRLAAAKLKCDKIEAATNELLSQQPTVSELREQAIAATTRAERLDTGLRTVLASGELRTARMTEIIADALAAQPEQEGGET